MRHPHVDLIAFTGSTADRQAHHAHRGRLAEEGQSRDERHRSLHRLRGRRPRHRGARRGVGALPECRPGVHVGQAVLCRGCDRRRVRRALRGSWRARSWSGDPRRPETDMGPVISSKASGAGEAVDSKRRSAKGRSLVAGGGPPGRLRAAVIFSSPPCSTTCSMAARRRAKRCSGPVAAIVRVRERRRGDRARQRQRLSVSAPTSTRTTSST